VKLVVAVAVAEPMAAVVLTTNVPFLVVRAFIAYDTVATPVLPVVAASVVAAPAGSVIRTLTAVPATAVPPFDTVVVIVAYVVPFPLTGSL
jgi:hypothetical protein